MRWRPPSDTKHTHRAAPIRTNRLQNNNQTTLQPLRRRGTRTYPPESAQAARSTAEPQGRPLSSPRAHGTEHRAMLWLCFPGLKNGLGGITHKTRAKLLPKMRSFVST